MKRLLLFLLLMALGAAILHYAIGEEAVVAKDEPVATNPEASQGSGSGVAIQHGQIGAKWQIFGPLHVPKVKAIKLPNGGERNEKVFDLDAKDSTPIADGVQQLDDMTVMLFDHGVPAATIVARQAFVELGRDLNGEPSLKADKEIDLRDAVFETLPNSKMAGVRLEIGNAMVLVRDDFVQIHTATKTDPVLLQFSGRQGGTLRGNGLQARLPRDPKGTQRTDIDILHDAVLTMDGIEVSAKGPLHYAEDNSTGAAELTATDDVQIVATRMGGMQIRGLGRDGSAAKPTKTGPATLRGNQLVGWLQRGKRTDEKGELHEQMVWRLAQVHGNPVTAEVGGLRLQTPTLTLVPGMSGEPLVVTGAGGPSRVDQVLDAEQLAKGEVPMVGTSPRRIQLLRSGEQAAALHRAFGFPQWTLRQLQDQQVVAFEGNAEVASGNQVMRASKGLHLFRPNPDADAVVVRGFGEVYIEQKAEHRSGKSLGEQDLTATGSDGFRLLVTPTHEVLTLGPSLPDDLEAPDAAWRQHRYSLRQGPTELNGVGACQFERTGTRSTVQLRAPDREIRGHLSDQSGEVTAVRSLRVTLVDKVLVELFVAGLPAVVTFEQGGEKLSAAAPVLEQIGPSSWCLLPPRAELDPSLWRGLAIEQSLPQLRRTVPASKDLGAGFIETVAPRIELHYLGRTHMLVDALAVGDQMAKAWGTVERLNHANPTKLSLEAARLRLFPFAISPEAIMAHRGGATGTIAELPFFALSKPWILADRVLRLAIVDDEMGEVEGSGHLLLLSQGAKAAVFLGDAERLTPALVTQQQKGRRVIATGARVRVYQDPDLRLQALRTFPGHSTFLLPTIELHEPGTGTLAHIRAKCRGDIEVLPTAVMFLGPVAADSLDANGTPDPKGMHVEADRLRMDLHATSHAIVKIVGNEVDLDWEGIKAHSAEIELDPIKTRFIARDPKGSRVDFANGRRFLAEHIEVNYETMAVYAYQIMLRETKPPSGEQR